MAFQGDACGTLRETTAVGWRGVEIVHPVFYGVVNQSVHCLLVNFLVLSLFRSGLRLCRQSHHAIAKEGNSVARGVASAVGHFVLWYLAVGG